MNDDKLAQNLSKAIEDLKSGDIKNASALSKDVLSKASHGSIAEQAGQIYTQLNPDDYWGYNQYGLILFANKKLSKAGKQFAAAVNLKEDYAEAWGNYANVLHQLGLLKEAEEFSLKALEHISEKQKNSLLINYINILIDREKFDTANDIINALPKDLEETSVSYNVTLGVYYDRSGAPDKAVYCFEKAFALSPDNPNAQSNLATLYSQQQMFDKASKIWEILSKNPKISATKQKKMAANYRCYQKEPADNELILTKNSLNNIKSLKPEAEMDEIDDLYRLVTVNNFKVYPDSWGIFDDEHIFMDLMFHINIGEDGLINEINALPQNITCPIDNVQNLDGRYLLLAGCDNYYHWIIDYLPRLKALQHHPDYKDLPFLMNSNITGFQKASLEVIGIDLNRLVQTKKDQVYQVEKMIIPHMTNRVFEDGYVPAWMTPCVTRRTVDWLRDSYKAYMAPRKDLPKRIFLSRAGADFRRCVNEDEVFKLAKDYGFEIVANEKLSFTDQIALYAGAEAVMGVHGAGYTNTVFSPEGIHIIEMFAGQNAPEFYKVTANLMNQHHQSINGRITRSMKPLGPEFWDFEVNLDHIKDALDKI